MPARAGELERAARKLGFVRTRQKGSHARWQHADGRATKKTIPAVTDLVAELAKGVRAARLQAAE